MTAPTRRPRSAVERLIQFVLMLWRRATREGAAAAMVGGVTTTFLWKALGPSALDPVLPGFLVSAFLWWSVSLLTPPPPPEAVAPYFVRSSTGVSS